MALYQRVVTGIVLYLHFSNEGPQLADNFTQDPGVLLPVDAQVVWQPCANIDFYKFLARGNKIYLNCPYRIGELLGQKWPARRGNSWWPCASTGFGR